MTPHTVARGYSLVARRCLCGSALTVMFRGDNGRDWCKCPNDPRDWNEAFRRLEDQSEAGFLAFIEASATDELDTASELRGLN